MPFCLKKNEEEEESKLTAQKIVIPRGMINPNETTIIEIPARLHNQPFVIAKRKVNSPGLSSETYRRVPDADDSAFYPEDYVVSQSRAPQKLSRMPDNYQQFKPMGQSSFKDDPNQNTLQMVANRPKYCNDPFPIPTPYPPIVPPTPPQKRCVNQDLMMSNTSSNMYETAHSKNLDDTERDEKMALERSLVEFQQARRKLIDRASHLANKSAFDNYSKY